MKPIACAAAAATVDSSAAAPARARVFIETYGCAFNQADSEAMAGLLSEAGYPLASSAADADVIIVNTCSVKDRTQRELEKRLGDLRTRQARGGPRVVVAGCLPKAAPAERALAGLPALGPATLDRVVEVIEAALAGEAPRLLDRARRDPARLARPLLPVRRTNPTVEIIPLASGCLSACTFCQTRLARGTLQSYRPADLLLRAERAIGEGATELWLTAQDTGAYGRDIGHPLPRLLARMLELPGDFRLRLGMSSPQWLAEDLPAWMDLLGHPRLFCFLHVPVQSGSPRVLQAMQRGHGLAEFAAIAEALRAYHPEAALVTDLIVGYPGESDEDFAATLRLVEVAGLCGSNVSKFSPRPGTPAAGLPPLPGRVVAERSRVLRAEVERVAAAWHARHAGRILRVRTAEHRRAGSTVAHTRHYRPVVLPGNLPLGQWHDVRITGTATFHLIGEQMIEPQSAQRATENS